MPKESILLDTHTWLWLINGDTTLLPKTQGTINSAAAHGKVFVSTISSWEISMLESKGRIILGRPCLDWITTSLSLSGIKTITLSPEIAVESSKLPGNFHGDPADRIIVATARLNGLSVITRDDRILKYSKQNFVKAIKA